MESKILALQEKLSKSADHSDRIRHFLDAEIENKNLHFFP